MKIFWFLWGLPQNLIGGLMFLLLKNKSKKIEIYKDSTIVFLKKGRGAVSLGKFIFFFSDYGVNTLKTIKHEYGHSIQSKILGPLYLIIIGLPSIVWAGLFKNYRKETGTSYYSFYTEKWADKLGGVER